MKRVIETANVTIDALISRKDRTIPEKAISNTTNKLVEN